jgi:hypothetical protein
MTDKITYLPNSRLNREKWDDLVVASVNRRIYATSRYLDVFSPGWGALILGGGEAFMPVTSGSKFGIGYVFQPLFIQQLGIFFPGTSCTGYFPDFIEELSRRYRFIDIALNEMNRVPEMHQVLQMDNYLLPLDHSHARITGRYSQNTRRNINKAEKAGLSLSEISPLEVIRLFAGNNGRKYRNIRKRDYARLNDCLTAGLGDGSISIIAARSGDGTIIAAACFLRDFDREVYFFSANTDEGRRKEAMPWLIDEFIKVHAGTGRLLDFNGSMNPGVARFYKSFGARGSCYHRLRINNLPFPVRCFKQFNPSGC